MLLTTDIYIYMYIYIYRYNYTYLSTPKITVTYID
ncbi:unnamed protein product [Spirodela intermedia]|uniref:Uncharacterized protein n=1 Tax=Spirodela intermedia TaxID=51605 RepID=A0A7I8K147_SPIIN|nr:unnamed protein product [Spirodela intermedia]